LKSVHLPGCTRGRGWETCRSTQGCAHERLTGNPGPWPIRDSRGRTDDGRERK
jgi:hypothetical protein